MIAARSVDEWRYLRAAGAVVLVHVVADVLGWALYRSSPYGPSALDRTEKCLRQEKLLQMEPVSDDAIAATARGGALATRVEDNGVHVVIAKSDDEAAELAQKYLRTAGRDIELRLDVRGRVLYVWEEAREPSPTQRQTMYDCWYE